ncbi:MAG: NTP transferase domain-containing protein [Butyricicoccus sp.]
MTKHILYLASGNSRRFGSNKLLYPLQGKPMYRYGLEMLHQLVQSRTDCTLTVVSQYEEIRQQAQRLGIAAVDSVDSPKGISFTIRAGLNALTNISDEEYVVFVVADQPYLTGRTVQRLLDAADAGAQTALVTYGEQTGNPALFSARLIPELRALEGDQGGRRVLRRHPEGQLLVPADSARELSDIDVPDQIP